MSPCESGCLRRPRLGWQRGEASLGRARTPARKNLGTPFDAGRGVVAPPTLDMGWRDENSGEPPRVSPLGVLIHKEDLLSPTSTRTGP